MSKSMSGTELDELAAATVSSNWFCGFLKGLGLKGFRFDPFRNDVWFRLDPFLDDSCFRAARNPPPGFTGDTSVEARLWARFILEASRDGLAAAPTETKPSLHVKSRG